MKKIIGIAAASALAIAAFGAPAAAAPDKGIDFGEAYCFGQVHKALNQPGSVTVSIPNEAPAPPSIVTLESVADAVKLVGGQTKNAVARGICSEDIEIVGVTTN